MNTHESEQLNELFTALAKAQLEMEVAKTDNLNPFFKSRYADFASVVRVSRPVLASNGLAVVQRIITANDSTLRLLTRLCHTSGQWMESEMTIDPVKKDIQSIGSYITYIKRYTYAAIVGVVTSNEDDDGEAAMAKVRNPVINVPPAKKDFISEEQYMDLTFFLDQVPDYKEQVEIFLNKKGIKNLWEMPKEAYDKILENAKIRVAENE